LGVRGSDPWETNSFYNLHQHQGAEPFLRSQ
jgi:hypothetical protein